MEFTEIYNTMANQYTELSGYPVLEDTDLGIRMKVLAGQIHSLLSSMDWLERQMFMDTAVGEYLDKHAETRGLTRVPATKAECIVAFTLEDEQDYDVVLEAGTVLAVDGDDSIRFELMGEMVIEAETTGGTGAARALEPGTAYNVPAGTQLTVTSTSTPGIMAAVYTLAVKASDEETDDSLRERLLSSCRNLSNGVNRGFYQQFLLNYSEVGNVKIPAVGDTSRTLDIYIAPKAENFTYNYVHELELALEEVREVGLNIVLAEAEHTAFNLKVQLTAKGGYTLEGLRPAIEDALKKFLCSVEIGGVVRIRHLYEVLNHIDGIYNFKFPEMSADLIVDAYKIPRLGTLTLEGM